MIYVDADACPVKAEIEAVATRHDTGVMLVSNGGLRPSANPLVQMIYVEQGPDVADMWIADRVVPGDIVVTADEMLTRMTDAQASLADREWVAEKVAKIRAKRALRLLPTAVIRLH